MPQFGAQIDTLRIPVKGLTPEQGTAFPSSPTEGLMCHRTDLKQAFIYLNAGWVQIDNVTGGTASNVTDGDKGMITVTGGVWNIDSNVVTSAMIVDGTVASGDLAAGAAAANLGAAGGDLTGTYPNPTIGTGKVDTTKILDGTIAIGDVNTGSVRLDNIGVPTANVSMNSFKITNLFTPSAPTDAANKSYVDGLIQGLDARPSVKAATTANITLSGAQTIDGIAVAAGAPGDRVLVKDQTTPAQNGIYNVSSGAWTRVLDMDAWAEVPSSFTFVEQGTVNADSGWVCTSDQGGTLETTAITWVQFSGAGQISAGAGLTKTGSQIDVGTVASSGLQVNADSIQVITHPNGAINLYSDGIGLGLDATPALAITAQGVGVQLKASGGVLKDGNGLYVDTALFPPASRQVIAGAGLTGGGDLTSSRNFDVGAGTGITVAADSVALDTTFTDARYAPISVVGTVKKFSADIGAMTAGAEQTITHNLNTLDVQAAFIRKTSIAAGAGAGPSIELTWRAITVNTIGVTADLPAGFAANEIRVIVEA